MKMFVSFRVPRQAAFRVAGIRRRPKVEAARRRRAKIAAKGKPQPGEWMAEATFRPRRRRAASSGEAARRMRRAFVVARSATSD